MKYEFKDEQLIFIPEDDADVFNLGKISTHFSKGSEWDTKDCGQKAVLKNVKLYASDIYVHLNLMFKKDEHHFVKRD